MRRPSHLAKPLLPDHPPLLSRKPNGERTVYVSPGLPPAMERPGGQWSLSDFQLNKQLYKGKASTLYKATEKVSAQVVALKTYSKRRLSDLNWYQVEREIRLHGQLRHPNIIQLHAAFEDDTHVFMVCEFAKGGDLYADLKQAGGKLKEAVVAGEVLPPFIDALAYMHARSIIHRDIKPENILLAADRTVKVADFGLSINWGEERPVTRAGTLDYMSPEVLLCPEKNKPEENKERLELGYSDSVDVWAVGILAYELLVGKPPFERESREETYQHISKQDPVLPEALSAAARDFILTALAKNPRKRPSMSDLLCHPWIQQHGSITSAASPMRTSEFHLPLQPLPSPYQDQARRSLHGAKSVRDFSTLLSAPSLSTTLHPTLSLAASLLPTASMAAADFAAALRPTTTHTRLGATATGTDSPAMSALSSSALDGMAGVLPPPGFPDTIAEGSCSEELAQDEDEDEEQQATETSKTAAVQQHVPAATAESVRDTSFVSALSSPSAGVESSGPSLSLTHNAASTAAAGTKLHASHSPHTSSSPAPVEHSAFLELYKSMAPAPGGAERSAAAHTPRAPPLGRKVSSNPPSTPTSRSSNKTVVDAGLPLLQHQQHQQQQQQQGGASAPQAAAMAKLPSLRMATALQSAPAEEVVQSAPEAGAALHAVAQQAAGVAAVQQVDGEAGDAASNSSVRVDAGQEEHAVLASIPEQVSGEAEVDNQADAVGQAAVVETGPSQVQQQQLQQPSSAVVETVDKSANAAVDTSEAVSPKIRAVQWQPAATPGSAKTGPVAESRQRQPSLEPENSMRSAHLTAVDRMREAEQKHVEKLRRNSTARTSIAASSASAGPKQQQQQPQRQPVSYGAGIARSATSLLNKLLGRKQSKAAAPGSTGVLGAAAAAGAAGSKGLDRSVSLGTAAGPSKSVASRYRMSAPAVHISVRAGGGNAAPPDSVQQQHTELPRSLLRRGPQGPGKGPGSGASACLTAGTNQPRSPTARRPVPGRAVPVPTGPAAEDCALPAISQGGGAEAAGVEQSSNSKSVRFAPLERSGPLSRLDGQDDGDLIPAFHSQSPSASYTSATSSLPSLTSNLTPITSRKSSLSPPISRKGSHVSALSSRGSVSRTAGTVGRYAHVKSRYNKVLSMPGDTSGGASRPSAMQREGSSNGAGDTDAVQRSAASWSAGAGRRAGAGQRKSLASTARLSMYRQLKDAGERSGHAHDSQA